MGKFELDRIFGDNMVLQRDKALNIFGSGPEGERVDISVQGRKASCTVINGRWEAELEPLETSFGERLEIYCAGETIILGNILVGEVWIGSGQSNMEFFLRYDEEREQILREGDNPHIRFYDVPRVSYPEQLYEADYSLYGIWRTCDGENLEYFSAVGYYFASRLNGSLDVPVGIIGCSWGGSPACAWMDSSCLEEHPLNVWLEDYARDCAALDPAAYEREFKEDRTHFKTDLFADPVSEKLLFGMDDRAMEEFMGSPSYSDRPVPLGPLDFRRPGGLFHAMVKQVIPFALRGIIWYQGESDSLHPDIYDRVLTRLIGCWREAWGEELPFLFVQLAPFRRWLHCVGDAYPLLREKQEQVARSVPRTWMASIMDAGMEKDIHPKRKRPPGERLALLAEGHVYGRDISCDPPEFLGARIENGKALLRFRHGDGLHRGEGPVDSLELFIGGKSIGDFRAETGEGTLTLFHRDISESREGAISFARRDYCRVNLFNGAGLPPKPFAFSWGGTI